MIKTAFVATLLLAGTPALAQTMQPATPATPATPASPAQPTPTAPSTDPMAPMTDGAAPTTSTTTTTTTPAGTQTASTTTSSDPVAATVEADWAKYDKDGNGKLSRTEFDTWMNALQTAAKKKPQTKAYLAAAFAKVDTDKSKSVSKEELTAFLKG